MNQDQNYYVIVGRDGTRAVSRWLLARANPSTGSDGYSFDREQEPASSTFQLPRACELVHEAKS